MLCLSMGISKLLNKYLGLLLKEEERINPAMNKNRKAATTFSQTRKDVLEAINSILQEVKKYSPGYDIKAHYSNEESGGTIAGFFQDKAVVGVLDASNCSVVYMFLRFIGAVVPLLKSLLHMVILSPRERVHQEGLRMSYGCPRNQFLVLKRMFMNYFRMKAVRVGNSEIPLPEYLSKHLWSVGSIEYLQAYLYEAIHKLFKETYKPRL